MENTQQQQAADGRLMRIDEVALRVGVTTRTISVWIREGLIPSKRLGRGVRRFVPSEIDAWIKAGGPTVAATRGSNGEAA
jgi:excisionase family DNA binding protein